MGRLKYDGIVHHWKVDLIAARARRMGFRSDEIPDLQQRIILEVLDFQYNAKRSNGATESTALQSLIDNQLKNICRSIKRYRTHVERSWQGRAFEVDDAVNQLRLDVQLTLEAMSDRERQVCELLSGGLSRHEIARQLDCSWHTVDRLVDGIQAHFEDVGLAGYLGCDDVETTASK